MYFATRKAARDFAKAKGRQVVDKGGDTLGRRWLVKLFTLV